MIDQPTISLIVPYSPGVAEDRDRIWAWLKRYWTTALPAAEIVEGTDPQHHLAEPGFPFSKCAAVNEAVGRSSGDVLVILDADAYVDAGLLLHCASEIRHAVRTGRRLWFVPYRHFWRLGKDATERVLSSDPRDPWHPSDPPTHAQLDPGAWEREGYGNFFAAMIMVMPRECFDAAGGFDPRFAGWGAEDITMKRMFDTIYSPHKTVDRGVVHLHHGTIGEGLDRQWTGQVQKTVRSDLGKRYLQLRGDRARMLELIAEWREQPREE